MGSLLLFPLHGALLVLWLAMLVVKVVALIDCASKPTQAFVSAGKLTKTIWLVILAVSLLLGAIGLIAALVYLLDVRPAVRGTSRGGW